MEQKAFIILFKRPVLDSENRPYVYIEVFAMADELARGSKNLESKIASLKDVKKIKLAKVPRRIPISPTGITPDSAQAR